MYIRSVKAVKIKLAFRNVHGETPEVALLDSGATENFLDCNVWKSMKIGRFKMERSIPIRNVDGTKNKSGNIEYFCWLLVNLGSERAKMKFYLTSLGNDRMILGYPFLWYFNPEIDWRTAQLKGQVTIETLGQTAIQRKIEEWTKIDRHHKWGRTIQARKTTTAQVMAHKAREKKPEAPAKELPKEYQKHWKVFSEKLAQRFPPKRREDMAIELLPGAPTSINCNIYPLNS